MDTHTTAQLAKLLKTTKGRTFTTMACTDILVEVVKADIIHTLTKLTQEGTGIMWRARVVDWGIHFECEGY
jgi:hypothetical protein